MIELRGVLEGRTKCKPNEDGTSWVLWLVRGTDGKLHHCAGVVMGRGESYVEGDALLLVGTLKDGKYGPTFRFVEALRQMPLGVRQIAHFIARCAHGKKLGIGKATAEKLAKHYGEEALTKLSDPACSADGLLSSEQAVGLAQAIKEESDTVMADAQWHAVLEPIKGLARRKAITSARGKRLPLERVRSDLYQLPLRRVAGCSFAKIDAPALTVGLPDDPALAARESMRRANQVHRHGLAIWAQIARTTTETGNVWQAAPTMAPIHAVAGLPAGVDSSLDLIRGLNYLLDVGWLERDTTTTPALVALQPQAAAERVIADRVTSFLRAGPGIFATLGPLDVSDHQATALEPLRKARLGLLTGGPGTGKTHVIGRVVQAVGSGRVTLAAPTGKAAVRITEALRAAGCGGQARTMHSLLGIHPTEDGEVGSFGGKPIEGALVVVDEVSMADAELLASFLARIPDSTTVLLVGDPGQLPPVGPGCPLRDLIAAGIPRAHLTETRRNAGMIVDACKTIAAGDTVCWFDLPRPEQLTETDNLAFRATRDSLETDHVIRQLLGEDGTLRQRFDPIKEVQVLTATNASRKRLNPVLKDLLNLQDNPGWNPGDKVICLKNGELSGKKVANGDTGEVLELLDEGRAKVRLTCPDREVTVRVPGSDTDEDGDDDERGWVALAYALTGHKAQGSEYPCVIIVADQRSSVTSREWIYTAISRAKGTCVVVGKANLLDAWCRHCVLPERRTKLTSLIRMKMEAR